jgi:hypothetical protein
MNKPPGLTSDHVMRWSLVVVVASLGAGPVACLPHAAVRPDEGAAPWDGRCPKGSHPYLLESAPRCVPDQPAAGGSTVSNPRSGVPAP